MPEQRRTWVQREYRSFNGIRGLAILLVFVNHYALLVSPRAAFSESLWVGVDIFFVLSGFLITGILLNARDDPDYYKSFYIRRALRIFPLYYGFFFALIAVTPLLHLWYPPVFAWSNLLYCQNIARVFPRLGNPTLFYLPFHHVGWRLAVGPLWSLCIEEQFYLFWPFLLRRLATRRRAMWFCGIAILLTIVLRCLLYVHDPAQVRATNLLYFLTFTRCDNLFIGAWLALWLRGTRLTRNQLHRFAFVSMVGAGLSLIWGQRWFSGSLVFRINDPFVCTVGFTLVGPVAAGLLLLSLDDQTAISSFFRSRPLTRFGEISYGFYFLHRLPYEALTQYANRHGWGSLPVLVAVFGIFAAVLVAASLSYRFYERPFLRLKDRFAPPHRP